jgi:hypothetical protein
VAFIPSRKGVEGRASERAAPHCAVPVRRRAEHHVHIGGARVNAGPLHLPGLPRSLPPLPLLLVTVAALVRSAQQRSQRLAVLEGAATVAQAQRAWYSEAARERGGAAVRVHVSQRARQRRRHAPGDEAPLSHGASMWSPAQLRVADVCHRLSSLPPPPGAPRQLGQRGVLPGRWQVRYQAAGSGYCCATLLGPDLSIYASLLLLPAAAKTQHRYGYL